MSDQFRAIAHNYHAMKSGGSAIFIKGIQPDMIEHFSMGYCIFLGGSRRNPYPFID